MNLDPGYITPAKLVLASTKDHAHRLYLADGIYAEVTLAFRGKQWQPLEWTYPDYRRADFQEFFTAAGSICSSIELGSPGCVEGFGRGRAPVLRTCFSVLLDMSMRTATSNCGTPLAALE